MTSILLHYWDETRAHSGFVQVADGVERTQNAEPDAGTPAWFMRWFLHRGTKRRQDAALRVFQCRWMEEEVNHRSCNEHLGARSSAGTETAVEETSCRNIDCASKTFSWLLVSGIGQGLCLDLFKHTVWCDEWRQVWAAHFITHPDCSLKSLRSSTGRTKGLNTHKCFNYANMTWTPQPGPVTCSGLNFLFLHICNSAHFNPFHLKSLLNNS